MAGRVRTPTLTFPHQCWLGAPGAVDGRGGAAAGSAHRTPPYRPVSSSLFTRSSWVCSQHRSRPPSPMSDTGAGDDTGQVVRPPPPPPPRAASAGRWQDRPQSPRPNRQNSGSPSPVPVPPHPAAHGVRSPKLDTLIVDDTDSDFDGPAPPPVVPQPVRRSHAAAACVPRCSGV